MSLPEKDQEGHSPIRSLFIQIGSLGEVFQSLMALRAAKQLYPELEITMIVKSPHEEVIKKVEWIKQVITLPVDEMLAPVLEEDRNDSDSMKIVAKWLSPIVKEDWDYVVNWTYSDASSFLSGLIPSKNKLGYSRRKDSTLACTDDWSLYVQGIVREKIYQDIHLTDIYTTQLLTALQINQGEPKDVGNEPVTSKSFFNLDVDKDSAVDWNWKFTSKKWLGIQLESNGIWKTSQWKEMISYILRRHTDYNVVLLGSDKLRREAREIEEYIQNRKLDKKRILSLVGKTDFDLWASVIAQCQWLVGSEPAAIHLASVLGTRVINISLGSQNCEEIGPYGNGHYVVRINKGCNLSPEAAYATWAYAASEWTHQRKKSISTHFSQLGWSDYLKDIHVYRSRIRPGSEGGGVIYQNQIQDGIDIHQWTSIVMGQIARAWYCGWTAPVGQEVLRKSINPKLLRDLRELQESIRVLESVCRKAEFISRQLEQKSKFLRSDRVMKISDKEDVDKLSKKLSRLDQLIDRTGRVHPSLNGFSNMIRVMMHNVPGETLIEISQGSVACYHRLTQGVDLMRHWVTHTLALARPQSVTNSKQSADRIEI